ncbi:MAG: filamentous hemagglutinin N-terminal domain-containing protein [Verrucomicrobiae bacterium]|nr:filamentous hemagglutinin N-terminal domain-containing protein [Verrucomicrobiae bacterium]MCB1085847.1 filamentous hemagglutinin N-terminal domain-containing protein [Verrucomicrobiae bacterium]
MKRLLLPGFVVAYTLFGVALLLQMPRSHLSVSGASTEWDPPAQVETIHISSRRCVIHWENPDLSRVRFVRDHPDGTILIRVTGGRPTHLTGPLPDGVFLINPSGVIVGPTAMVEPGGIAILSTEEFSDAIPQPPDPIFLPKSPWNSLESSESRADVVAPPFLPESGETPSTRPATKASPVLVPHGNVYALAIRKADGSTATAEVIRRQDGKNGERRVFLSAPPQSTKATVPPAKDDPDR